MVKFQKRGSAPHRAAGLQLAVLPCAVRQGASELEGLRWGLGFLAPTGLPGTQVFSWEACSSLVTPRNSLRTRRSPSSELKITL